MLHSVCEELYAFIEGLVFARSDWCQQWNPVVYAFDSSLSGW